MWRGLLGGKQAQDFEAQPIAAFHLDHNNIRSQFLHGADSLIRFAGVSDNLNNRRAVQAFYKCSANKIVFFNNIQPGFGQIVLQLD